MRRRGITTAAVIAVAGSALLAGCGQETLAAQQARSAAAAAAIKVATAGNSGCVQATPVVDRALGVMGQLKRGPARATAAQRPLAASQTSISSLARTTSDDVLQENLAELADALAAFRTVMLDPSAPAYQQTYSDLAGKLAGFRRLCSVGNSGFETGNAGWAAANGNTVLSRSPTAHDGQWSLKISDAAGSSAATGFTDSPPWVPSTLRGSEQIGLWARALTGTPILTLQVREMSGSTLLGSQQVTMRLDTAFRFANLTYQVRRPGSRLSVTVWATGLTPGGAALVDDITIVRQ
jgi:hypothetical protein